jgi:hypothetical protein
VAVVVAAEAVDVVAVMKKVVQMAVAAPKVKVVAVVVANHLIR